MDVHVQSLLGYTHRIDLCHDSSIGLRKDRDDITRSVCKGFLLLLLSFVKNGAGSVARAMVAYKDKIEITISDISTSKSSKVILQQLSE